MQSEYFTIEQMQFQLRLHSSRLDIVVYPGGICTITDLDLGSIDLGLFSAMMQEARELGLLYFGSDWSK